MYFFTFVNRSRVIVTLTVQQSSHPLNAFAVRKEMNLIYIGTTHYMARKWSLSGSLEDCCHPLTTFGKMQQCEGTNLAMLLYHSYSRDQKPQLPLAAVKLWHKFQQIAHKTESWSKTDFSSILFKNMSPPPPFSCAVFSLNMT